MRNPIGWLAVVLGLAVGQAARADEEQVPLKSVPGAAVAAVKAKFPEAKIKSAAREEEDGKTVYELTLVDEDDDEDETIDVTVTADGKILSIEETIEEEDLPNAVLGGLKKKYPKSEIEKAEKVTEKGVVTYEILIEDEADDDEKFEVVLNKAGKILKVTEVDEGKEEKNGKAEKEEKKEKGEKGKKDKEEREEKGEKGSKAKQSEKGEKGKKGENEDDKKGEKGEK